MSDTPISDSTPHNIADLGMLCRRLERELNAANSIIRQQQLLDEENLRLKDRIKRLEEAGDVLCENSNPSRWDSPYAGALKLTEQSNWLKAKEAKP